MDRSVITENRFSWKRIFLPMLIVPLILGVILSVIIFFVTRDQLMKTGRMSVEKFHTQAAGILNELNIVTDALLNNEQFLGLINQKAVSYDEIKLVVRTIRNTLSRNPFVLDALVISRQHNKTYAGDSYYDYGSFVSLLQKDIGYIENADSFTEEDLKEGWMIPYNNYSSPFLVSYIYCNDDERAAILVVILDKAHLYRSISASNTDFCCMYNNSFYISTFIKSDPDTDYSSAEDISGLVGTPVEIFSIQDEHYTYMTALKRNDFYRPLYLVIIGFGIYFLIVLLFEIIHIRNTNHREKAYFSSLVNELPQPVSENEDLSGIFSSIRNALEKYKEEHLAFSEQQKYNNLAMLAQGYQSVVIDSAAAASMGIDIQALSYYMIRFHISEEGILNPGNRSDLLSIIIETSLNGFAGKMFQAVCFPKDNDICGILNIYEPNLRAEDIQQAEEHTRRLLEKDYGVIFTCTLSHAVSNLSEIPKAFHETTDLLRFVHAIDSNALFISADEMQNAPVFLLKGEYLKQMQMLSGILLLGKYDMVSAMVDSILEDHVSTLRKNYILAEERLNGIIGLLYEAPLPSYLTEEQIEIIHDRLRKSDSIASVSQIAHDTFDNIHDSETEDSVMEKARSFIAEQISNDMLSVPEIAEHVGVSAKQLSKQFKESTSMTMVEYINQFRCTKVQELLEQTQMNISEIAKQTGYTNTVTLNRNLKKYVGCTPSEYREKIHNIS